MKTAAEPPRQFPPRPDAPSLAEALAELHQASGAEAVVWLLPTVVAGELWWGRVRAIGAPDLVRTVESLRGLRVVGGDLGGPVDEEDDVHPPLAPPPWVMLLRDDRFRRLDAELTAQIIGWRGRLGDDRPRPSPGEVAEDVAFAAWFVGATLNGVVGLLGRSGAGRLGRTQLERAAAALQEPAVRRAAAAGIGDLLDVGRPLHLVTDLHGRVESSSVAGWDTLPTPERRQLEALALDFHTSDRNRATVVCALAAIRLERLTCGDGSRTLVAVQPAQRLKINAVDRLTLRQREIVGYAVAGATLAEIARSLDLSPYTVKDHLRGAYEALGVASRVELLALMRPAR